MSVYLCLQSDGSGHTTAALLASLQERLVPSEHSSLLMAATTTSNTGRVPASTKLP